MSDYHPSDDEYFPPEFHRECHRKLAARKRRREPETSDDDG